MQLLIVLGRHLSAGGFLVVTFAAWAPLGATSSIAGPSRDRRCSVVKSSPYLDFVLRRETTSSSISSS